MFRLSDILLSGCTVLRPFLKILIANFGRGAVDSKYLFSIVYMFWWYERFIPYYLEINVVFTVYVALLLRFVYLQINRTDATSALRPRHSVLGLRLSTWWSTRSFQQHEPSTKGEIPEAYATWQAGNIPVKIEGAIPKNNMKKTMWLRHCV